MLINKPARIACALFVVSTFTAGLRAQSANPGTPQPQPTQDAQPAQPQQPLVPETTQPNDQGDNDLPAILQEQADQQQNQQAALVYQPLAGIQEQTLGSYHAAQNFLVPGFDLNEIVDTNGLSALGSGQTGLASVTYAAGGIKFERDSQRSATVFDYFAGRSFSPEGGLLDSTMQGLAAAQTFRWHRSTLLFADQFSYLPESPFGFAGGGNIQSLGLGGDLTSSFSVLQQDFLPNQTVLTGRGTRISNTAATEYDYRTGPLSSLTFAGGYGLLNFDQPGFVDSWNAFFVGGYNRTITRRDTVAVLYRFNAIRFNGVSGAINDNLVQFAYGRSITNRLAFQVAAGPEVDSFQNPGIANQSRVTASVNSGLTWQTDNSSISSTYSHGLTGGGGVLTGAETDQLQTTFARRLTRTLRGSVGGGYAWNRGISQAGPADAVLPSYSTYFISAQLSRAIGRNAAINLGYTFQSQDSSQVCTLPGCQGVLLRHQVSIGFSWHADPIQLR